MIKFLRYLLGEKLVFFLVNVFASLVALFTIAAISSDLFHVNGDLRISTLVLLVMNALFLVLKTLLNISSLIISYKLHITKDKELSQRTKKFKEIIDKDFRP